MGFWRRHDEERGWQLEVSLPMVAWRSLHALQQGDWTLGGERLISSARRSC